MISTCASCTCALPPPARDTYASVVRRSLEAPAPRPARAGDTDRPVADGPSPSSSMDLSSPDESPSRRRLLGRPRLSLPISQLTLGRTTPPWMASAWKTGSCAVRGGVLRVEYPRGSGAFSRGAVGGCNFKARPHALPASDVTLAYKVRFPDRFPWSRGGKLPGLFVGTGRASGGDRSTTAASCRVMWVRNGQAVAYVYLPSGVRRTAEYAAQAETKGEYGDEVFGRGRLFFVTRDWNDVVVRVKLNSFDDDGRVRSDGVLSLSVNGRAATVGGVVWRVRPQARVEHVAVTSFFGGKWTAPAATYADFAAFALTT